MGLLTGDLDSVGVMEGHQRTEMGQFLRKEEVVYLLARTRPHVHVGWPVPGGLGGPQGGNDLPAFIGEDRDSHLFGLRKVTAVR